MIGGRLKQLREARGLRQEDIARIAGVTPEAIGMYENDRREPKGEILRAIAAFIGTSTDYLLGLTDDPAPPGTRPKPAHSDTEFRAFLRGRKLSDKDIELILQLEERMRRENEEKKKGQ